MNTSISKLIIAIIIVIVSLGVAVGVFYVSTQMYFGIAEYKYFEYDNQKYYLDSNLDISDAIIYNDDGEYHSYQNCTEVTVKINGWFPKKMLLHKSNDKMFIFDKDKLIWGIKNGEKAIPELKAENISNVGVTFWNETPDYKLSTSDVEKLLTAKNSMLLNSTKTIEWENAPDGTKNGTLNICYNTFSNDVTYSTIYFSVTEKGVFLMSLTDNFGLKYGSYVMLNQ